MWYYESDGGGWWESGRHIRQPRTHYLVKDDLSERIDCASKREATRLRDKLNQEERKEMGNATCDT